MKINNDLHKEFERIRRLLEQMQIRINRSLNYERQRTIKKSNRN